MSSNKTVIAVDAMGGDLGPSVVVPGAIEAARQTGAKILLVGNEATLDGELNRLSPSGVDLEIVHAPEVAGMDEKPSDILRRKKNASIQVACRLVPVCLQADDALVCTDFFERQPYHHQNNLSYIYLPYTLTPAINNK